VSGHAIVTVMPGRWGSNHRRAPRSAGLASYDA